MSEAWKPIPDFEGYEVSDHGQVRSLDRTVRHGPTSERSAMGRTLKPSLTTSGYLKVTLCNNRQHTTAMIHRIVLSAFGDQPPTDAHECNHIDGNKTNNRNENLEWVTSGENKRHAFENGLSLPRRGEASSSAKLTAAQVEEIRELYASGKYLQKELGAMFGVTGDNVGRIIRKETWIKETSND